ILRILDIAKNDHALEPRLRAGSLTTYATALRQQARLEEALVAGFEALGALEDGLGRRHPHVVLVRLELAKIYDAQGEPDQGREQLVFAAEVAADVFGPEHPETLRIRELLELSP
ncbi:MAG: hypothetical protein KUG77_04825, partial [Nannocystaceae bacterium]|nr:hypothetical protein [Nannocystaceae bacterium]